MYAVIFRAEINALDAAYFETATKMRDLAMREYGCIEFFANTEGNSEVAISYWPSLENIRAWKSNSEHQQAQALGKAKWYKSYQVQIVEVIKEYGSKSA